MPRSLPSHDSLIKILNLVFDWKHKDIFPIFVSFSPSIILVLTCQTLLIAEYLHLWVEIIREWVPCNGHSTLYTPASGLRHTQRGTLWLRAEESVSVGTRIWLEQQFVSGGHPYNVTMDNGSEFHLTCKMK